MEVLKVTDITERQKIEKWTDDNTFPDIIRFIQDGGGNFIVGEEVLNDPAYEKLGIVSNKTPESLKAYLTEKAVPVLYATPAILDTPIDIKPIEVLPSDIKPI